MSNRATSPPSAKSMLTATSSSPPSPPPIVVVAPNNGQSKQPGQENNNMVEISIDTSSHLVDIRQQDSGSNQSGSDSGLGYTNSISSDNSSFIAATSQDQTASKQSIINNNISNGNNNNTLLKHNSPSSSITSQIPKEVELTAIDETKTSSIEENKKQSFELGFKVDHAPQLQFKSDDELGRRPRDALHRANELVSTIQPPAPVIKSLLKKSSQFNDGNGTTNQHQKHNRNVSFNQTVIVFCEETELPSSVDQFDPPVGYQDSMSSSEPPEDYCDHENERIEKNPVDVYDNETSVANFGRVLKNRPVSNLNDDPLFSLLDNDSLLESFKINCEDFSEDDFPINYLNSSHSYLCNDAISDYDSDSESSLCVERDRHCSTLPPVTKSAKQHVEKDASVDTKPSSNCQDKPTSSPSNAVMEELVSLCQPNQPKNLKDERLSSRSTKPSGNQKSMPARMKVSTVDSNHSKRNLSRKEDADSKLKPESGQNFSAKKLQPDRHSADEHLDATRLTPMVIKQSTVEPVSLSKPIIVRSNLEQSSNTDRAFNLESTIITSGPQSLVAQEQPILMKECNVPNETVTSTTQAQKLQHSNQTIVNTSQMPPSQLNNQPSCQICRVIESNRSQTNPEQKAANQQDVRAVKSFNHNNVERENHESQPNQVTFVKAPDNQPIVFNQSCVSCREALIKQQQATQEIASARTDAQPVRSVTYQLVYVVDQKGNRVRALSVRPAFNAPVASLQQAVLAGRRILIAQNGQRFRNPISFTDQINNLQNNPQVTAHPQCNQNLLSNSNTQQYRIIETAQLQNTQQAQHHMELRGPQIPYIRGVPPIQKVPLESFGLRQHTVYYVRQPLDTQNIRQSHDVTRPNYRSFPDPHEIRRLDGLRGPTTAMSLSRGDHNLKSEVSSNANIKSDESARRVDISREDVDDPTFGFSKRPSVKVVSTISSNSPLSTLTTQSYASSNTNILNPNHDHCLNPNNISTLRHCTVNQPESTRPVSLVVMGSQTLDRRSASSQQNRGVKENIPSTSSMSNIHGTFVGIPPTKVNNTSTNQQQQRISNVQLINPTINKITSKGMSYSSVKRWLSSKLTHTNPSAN